MANGRGKPDLTAMSVAEPKNIYKNGGFQRADA